MKSQGKNAGASVRGQLLSLAQKSGEDFQLLLLRYANERFLYRMSRSPHGVRFVLKGATLFTFWTGKPHRTTRDIDLLGFGDSSDSALQKVFGEILSQDVGEDGVVFDIASLQVTPIREDQEYGGTRVTFTARISSARLRLQVDVGFGDVVTPAPLTVEFPTLLALPAATLRVYPQETVVAEKLEAMVKLGEVNSRMKDFYDVALLCRTFPFDGDVLVHAVRATFQRRNTPFPQGPPVALTLAFATDPRKVSQWMGFLRKSGLTGVEDLAGTVASIAAFATPVLLAAGSGNSWRRQWPNGGPWSEI